MRTKFYPSEKLASLIEGRGQFYGRMGKLFFRAFNLSEVPSLMEAQAKGVDAQNLEQRFIEINDQKRKAASFSRRAKAVEYVAGGLSGLLMTLGITTQTWTFEWTALASFMVSACALKIRVGFEVSKEVFRNALDELNR